MAVVHESGFLVSLLDRHQHMDRPTLDSCGFSERLGKEIEKRSWPIKQATLQRMLSSDSWHTAAEAVNACYLLYAESQGKTLYADKTPRYSLHVHRLARWFPRCRFVHIVRDGRDVAKALADQDFGPNSVCAAAGQWAWYAGSAHQQGERLGRERYIWVKYEELVSQPVAVLRAVCAFLGLRYSDAMLSYSERADAVIGTASGQTHHESLRQPLTVGLRNWRNDLSDLDVARIDIAVGQWLTVFGYDRCRPAAPLTTLLGGHWARWQFISARRAWEARQQVHRWRGGLRRQNAN